MLKPLVSAIIPSFNRAELTLRAIHSVLNQSFENIELLVINDGSSEDYLAVQQLLEEKKGIYLETENQGVSAARNLGIELSKGEYIAFLDSDDEWLADKIYKQVEVISENPKYPIVQALERWNRNGKIITVPKHLSPAHGESFKKAVDYCCIGPSSALIRKELFNEIGLFDPCLRICEDYDLWLRILDKYPVFCIQEELSIKYGGHSDQLSRSEVGIDRFRVYALVKYLMNANDLEKISIVKQGILKRLKILISGAEKRGFIDRVQEYNGLFDIVDKSSSSPPSILPAFLLN